MSSTSTSAAPSSAWRARGAGAGMLRNVPLMLEITSAVVRAVDIPVTVKTRLGWDTENLIITDLAERLQDCGIAALTIHGRTRAQMYTGEADWTLIGEVKRNPRIRIPIIGNGDITTPQRAKECFDRYGVDGIMVGRASFGRPWIFSEIRHYLQTGEPLTGLTAQWKLDVLRREVDDSVRLLDERRGILHVRRHLAASPVFKGIPNFRETRIAMLRAETRDELFELFRRVESMPEFNDPRAADTLTSPTGRECAVSDRRRPCFRFLKRREPSALLHRQIQKSLPSFQRGDSARAAVSVPLSPAGTGAPPAALSCFPGQVPVSPAGSTGVPRRAVGLHRLRTHRSRHRETGRAHLRHPPAPGPVQGYFARPRFEVRQSKGVSGNTLHRSSAKHLHFARPPKNRCPHLGDYPRILTTFVTASIKNAQPGGTLGTRPRQHTHKT